MNKILKYFCSLCIILFGTCVVSAKAGLNFEWKNDAISAEANETIVTVKDGYLTGGYNEDFLAHIAKYDGDGKEVNSITFDDNFTVVGLHEKDDKYYAIVLDDWWFVSVYVMDKNLEVIDSIKYDYYIYDFNDVVYFADDYIYITSTGWYEYGGIADQNDENFFLMMKISYDLKDMKLVEYNELWDENVKLLMEAYPDHNYLMFQNIEYSIVPIATAGNDKVNVVVGKQSIYDGSGTWIAVYNKDNELIKYNYVDGTSWWYVDVVVLDDLIYAIGNNYNLIDVYNLEGELVNSIDLKELYLESSKDSIHISVDNIEADEGGLILSYQLCDIVKDCAVNCRASIAKYQLLYNVIAKTDGNGKVSVSSDVNNVGKDVTFVVEPNEGYVLGEVKVTDANGNVVVFTDYTFSMPSADVTIEATFIKNV